jgi:hypothetical protein
VDIWLFVKRKMIKEQVSDNEQLAKRKEGQFDPTYPFFSLLC